METRDCSECRYYTGLKTYPCHEGHKPRFYKPKSPIDTNWGHKRKCEDFDDKDEDK